MAPWLLALLVLSPALGYAAVLYLFDLHEREPLWALALLFLAGAACVPLAFGLERGVDALWPFVEGLRAGRLLEARVGCFLVIAPAEELTKLGVVALLARRKLMDEPVDGVVYAGIAALGFATAEGLLTMLHASPFTVLMRGVLATPAHLCFSALWGAGLGALRYWGRPALPAALWALAGAIVAHGTYDYLLVIDGGVHRGGVVAVLAAAAAATALLFRGLLSASPYRDAAPRPGRCPSCQHGFPARARFCARCGALVATRVSPPVPIGLSATLLGFTAQVVVLVSGSVLVARVYGESAPRLWSVALASPSSRTWPAASLVMLGASATGLAARLHRGRFAVLEAAVATALVLLCALLFLALTDPSSLLGALALAPLSLAVSALSARATRA